MVTKWQVENVRRMSECEISVGGLCFQPDDSYPVWLPVFQIWSVLCPAYVLIKADPGEMLLQFL